MQLIKTTLIIILCLYLFGCSNRKSADEIYKVIECANEEFLKYNENELMYVNLSDKRWYHSYIENTDFSIYSDTIFYNSPLPLSKDKMATFIKDGINYQSKLLSPAQAKDTIRHSDFDNNIVTILSHVGVSGDLYFLTLSYMYNSRGGVITSFIIEFKIEHCSVVKIIPGPMI